MEDGAKAHREGRYAEAEKSWQAAVRQSERFGPEYHLFLSLNNLVVLYHTQAKYAEAEPLSKRSVAIVRKLWNHTTPWWLQASTT